MDWSAPSSRGIDMGRLNHAWGLYLYGEAFADDSELLLCSCSPLGVYWPQLSNALELGPGPRSRPLFVNRWLPVWPFSYSFVPVPLLFQRSIGPVQAFQSLPDPMGLPRPSASGRISARSLNSALRLRISGLGFARNKTCRNSRSAKMSRAAPPVHISRNSFGDRLCGGGRGRVLLCSSRRLSTWGSVEAVLSNRSSPSRVPFGVMVHSNWCCAELGGLSM